MAIEGVTGISSSNEQHRDLVIPVTHLVQAQKKQIEQNQGDSLQNNTTLEEPSKRQRDISENLDGQIKQANQLAESLDRGLRFFVHEDSGRPAVNVVDNSTHQVIKTVPPEQFLDLVAKVTKVAGIFFDEFA